MNLSDTSVLISFRSDGAEREAAWDYLSNVWSIISANTGLQVCVATDGREQGEPFNLSAAQNRAFEQSNGDYLIMLGADCIPDLNSINAARFVAPWVPLFHATEYYNAVATELIVHGGRMPGDFETDPELAVPFCCGPVGLTRNAYLMAGGMDERFEGWGFEDTAFRQTLGNLFGVVEPLPYTLRCLWHPVEHRIVEPNPNRVLMDEYEVPMDADEMCSFLRKRGAWIAGTEYPQHKKES